MQDVQHSCWLVGWLVDGWMAVAGRLVGWLVSWLVGWLVGTTRQNTQSLFLTLR